MKRLEYPMAAAILAAALVLYLPTLRTGFLTDDFLDCSHTFDEAAGTFTGESSGGYRPLMTLAWALERAVWSAQRPEAWHISSLFILAVFCFSLTALIRGFVNQRSAVLAALALVLLCYPVAVSAARVSWRATMLAGVPFIWAMILKVRWCRRRSPLLLLFGALLFLVSLLFKETFLAAPPVFAALGNAASSRGKRLRNSALLYAASLVAVLVYGAMRYSAMGLQVNYQETTRFGLHTLSNLLLYGGSVFRPWLSMVPARVLLFTLTLPVFFLVREWKHRFLILSLGLFPLLPVVNLGVRPDLAVAAVPAGALFIAFLFQRLKGSRVLLALFAVFLLGVFQHSLDQVRILAAASRAVNETTDRLALIAEEVPGNSPLFIIGAPMSVGDYGTFWPGEFMIPLRCRGHEPGRQVAGTGALWELLAERESGYMVFLGESDHRVYPVSSGMFTEQGDTLVHLLGGMDAGGLFEYPSCTADDQRAGGGEIYIITINSTDVVPITPLLIDNMLFYDLASIPEWLAREPGSVLFSPRGVSLRFSSRNLSVERAAVSASRRGLP